MNIKAALASRKDLVPREANILILSGGGKWGAYGAGFYKAWGDHGRPTFDVVTGVSTGAMQSTFAFLGRADDLEAAYSINKESELVKRHGSLFFLSHGSTADLSPLRERVGKLLTPEVLDAVAAEEANGRRLFVGTINALDGKMYAIDLTRMARDLKADERSECFVGAIMSSAAIPAVFRQTTLNGVPYYDAGVRNSVFFIGSQEAFLTGVRDDARQRGTTQPANVYVIMNGDPGVKAITQPPGIKAALIPTLMRLQAIAFDQLEQGSVYNAHIAASRIWETRTYIASAHDHPCTDPNQNDEDIFDPEFMRCLIKYGEGAYRDGSPWEAYPAKP